MAYKQHAKLPNIQSLLQDSWELFQKTFFSYLKLICLGVAFLFLGALIGIFISLPVTIITIGSHFQVFRHLTLFYASILVFLGLWFILYVVSIVVMGVIFPIVSIFILQEKKNASLFDLIRQSKHLFLPYFLTMILSGVLVLGGMALFFVIPGILIAILFSFVAYEVVLDNRSGISALQRSYVMVSHYFWQVVGRVALLEIGMGIISVVLQKIAIGNPLVGFLHFLFSFAFVWYMRAYIFVLYKHIRARTTFPQHISMRWIWIVSIIGWTLFFLLLAGLITFGIHLPGMQIYQLPSFPSGTV